MESLTDEIEAVLFVAREVMVYQIPPRTTTAGYKAAEWNVESFLWKGRMRVLDVGSRSEIRLEDSNTGELFAQVNYVSPWNQVEPVLDSSRYFVLRVEGEGGKRAYIGMGFAERGESFDFQVALQSVTKRSQNISSSSNPSEQPQPTAPPKDYSLKDGQTFTIKIPGREGKKPSPSQTPSSGGGGGGGGLFSLPPPPPPGRRG
ncbi:adaptin ear-binding coat-associated protein 2 [Cryptococcus neoformans C23]|uniref:Adaptin ear-binding coat-associated protein 2 n=1 Tax=Cryptococcus neoformans (strain H99 / ATCC 208821 / CBS 10515 / FGSC 9487) TaxID=235443 RepID=J9VEV2_CRYN9|nr:adaptin ear-binding coat-associated protein 2 [Cryptococcus neoformans var. grubii H99]AUB22045.1 adaptin ear-binding coat-associated protein 2 [Cryptococcus neoformans var. grubii]OWZ36385.1 adaptin ear-binding coat-associated protein 2 [Cryptococcus neoformans var. grubii AD2-60a]OWZ48052.1 adaptin ear-binding coat-associated protein 2 [Cryptococcus neoformans var. grubii C23]OWZ57025.1 adaptin ear-binding coat-associated protein 2 [Cryptococcus neoformans var. grubii AD1-83a]OWZ80647.1 a|eukprot:XP_012046739.1 adaptin ear-binding coat-associated protein 2 [Cryptococcus neoformans var. grubii H99]